MVFMNAFQKSNGLLVLDDKPSSTEQGVDEIPDLFFIILGCRWLVLTKHSPRNKVRPTYFLAKEKLEWQFWNHSHTVSWIWTVDFWQSRFQNRSPNHHFNLKNLPKGQNKRRQNETSFHQRTGQPSRNEKRRHSFDQSPFPDEQLIWVFNNWNHIGNEKCCHVPTLWKRLKMLFDHDHYQTVSHMPIQSFFIWEQTKDSNIHSFIRKLHRLFVVMLHVVFSLSNSAKRATPCHIQFYKHHILKLPVLHEIDVFLLSSCRHPCYKARLPLARFPWDIPPYTLNNMTGNMTTQTWHPMTLIRHLLLMNHCCNTLNRRSLDAISHSIDTCQQPGSIEVFSSM